MNTFIQQGCIKLIKVTVKTFIMLQKIYISNKCLSFSLTFYSSNNLKNKTYQFPQKIARTVFNIDNNQFVEHQSAYIRMISEEHWSNDAENSALIKGIN